MTEHDETQFLFEAADVHLEHMSKMLRGGHFTWELTEKDGLSGFRGQCEGYFVFVMKNGVGVANIPPSLIVVMKPELATYFYNMAIKQTEYGCPASFAE